MSRESIKGNGDLRARKTKNVARYNVKVVQDSLKIKKSLIDRYLLSSEFLLMLVLLTVNSAHG